MKILRKKKKPAIPATQTRPRPPADHENSAFRGSFFGNSLLSLESRLMFDGAAVATAGTVTSDQLAQDQAASALSAADATTADTLLSAPTGEPQFTTEEQALFDALAAYDANEGRQEVVFVSSSVLEYQKLLDGISSNVEVYILDSSRDGVQQMAEVLAGRTGIDAIHLIGHGSESEIRLGSSSLSQLSISMQYAELFQQIGTSLSAEADLMIYGCDFGRGGEGLTAMQTLAMLTGADVAASDDATGHAVLGGDWILETQVGQIETGIVVGEQAQLDFVHILAAPSVDLNGSAPGNAVTVAFTEQTAVNIDPLGVVSDKDNDVTSLTVTLTTRPDGNTVESLSLSGTASSIATAAGLTVNYDSSTGVLSITGTASVAAYTTILQGILYNNTSDAPTTTSRTVDVVVRDNTPVNSANRTSTITMTAVNDAPDIADVTVSLNENSPNGTNVYNVSDSFTGTDLDRDGQAITYSITAGNTSGAFTINSATGAITVANSSILNRESLSSFTLTVQASDGSLRDTATITINLNDVDEFDVGAISDTNNTTNAVNENAATGTVVGITASASDADATNNTITYSLTNNALGRFQINSTTGVVSVLDGTLLDYETATSHTITVRGDSSDGSFSTQTFTISVNNVNDNAPTVSAPASFTVPEDVAGNLTYTGTPFADVDSGTLTVTLSIADGSISASTGGGVTVGGTGVARTFTGTTAALNTFFTTTGNITYTTALDNTAARVLTTQVSDGSVTTSTTSTVTVTPVNDAPTTSAVTLAAIGEDSGARLITQAELLANAGDVDGDALTATGLAISGGSGTLVDNGNGTWSYTPAGNDSTAVSFSYSITDGTATVAGSATLDITPVNDAPVLGGDATVTVVENQTVVGTFAATDPDAGDTVNYSLSGADAGLFTITASGVVSFVAAPDYETTPGPFRFTVTATDGGGLFDTQNVTVNVTDVNEALTTPPAPPVSTVPPSLVPTPSSGPYPVSPVSGPGPGGPPIVLVTGGGVASVLPPPASTLAPGGCDTGSDLNMSPATIMAQVWMPGSCENAETAIAEAAVPDDSDRETDGTGSDVAMAEKPPDVVMDERIAQVEEPLASPVKKMLESGRKMAANLDRLADDLTRSMEEREQHAQLMGRVASLSGLALTAGFSAGILRAGSLLMSFLVSMPVWRHFDPVPVLGISRRGRRKFDEQARAAQQEENSQFRGLEQVVRPESGPRKRHEHGAGFEKTNKS